MDWRNAVYWIVQVLGTFLCIAAFVNAVLRMSVSGGLLPLSEYLLYIGVFAIGLLLIFAGFLVKPKSPASIR